MASASSKKVIFAALIGNFLIALTKFIAFFVTKSSAMLSEGVHKIVDTGNQVRSKRNREILPENYARKRNFNPAYGAEFYFAEFKRRLYRQPHGW